MKIKFEWEQVDHNAYRAKVIGGWLLENLYCAEPYLAPFSASMAFIPDQNHEWEIDKEEL